MPSTLHSFPWRSEEALITHHAEGEDPARVHDHDVDADLAEEAAGAVLKVRNFKGTLALLREAFGAYAEQESLPAGSSLLLSPQMVILHLGILLHL